MAVANQEVRSAGEKLTDAQLAQLEEEPGVQPQEVQMAREGNALLTRSTICDWVIQCGFPLGAVEREMRREQLTDVLPRLANGTMGGVPAFTSEAWEAAHNA